MYNGLLARDQSLGRLKLPRAVEGLSVVAFVVFCRFLILQVALVELFLGLALVCALEHALLLLNQYEGLEGRLRLQAVCKFETLLEL